ncbi:MAG: hypothetical protein LBQ28_00605 [Prevotellaceae bacterium]|jgi:hypothetical protein|nr:hypothetical protein [Prevotellaceae bacterium]
MRKILKLTAILLILAGNFSSCGEEEPKEISFTEYSLVGTSCQWTNLDYEGKVIVINSNEELAQYITCTEGSFPEIDFFGNTLLLARGGTVNGIGKITISFFQNSTYNYKLNITVHLGITMVPEGWRVGILVPKLSNRAKISLDVKQTYE